MPLPYTTNDFALHVDRARAQVNTAASQTGPEKTATLASAQVHATLALTIATWLTGPQSRIGSESASLSR
jgi:4-hydroxybenzoate polyprenyltransferase